MKKKMKIINSFWRSIIPALMKKKRVFMNEGEKKLMSDSYYR